jgi:hypothetical protein
MSRTRTALIVTALVLVGSAAVPPTPALAAVSGSTNVATSVTAYGFTWSCQINPDGGTVYVAPFSSTTAGYSEEGPRVAVSGGTKTVGGFTRSTNITVSRSWDHRCRIYAAATGGSPLVTTATRTVVLPPFVVGATTSVTDTVGSGNTCAGFLDERTNLGQLAIRRVFTSAGAPPPADAVTCHTTYGAILWYSFKTSCTPTAVATGGCDTEIQNIATAMPAGSYLTYFHEPEDDMTGVQFVNAFSHAYQVAKAANATIKVVPVHMAYQWRPGSTNVTNNGTGGDREISDWIVPAAYADAYGVDLYWQASTRGSEPDDPVSVGSDPRMLRWYGAFGGLGEPLTLTEWGIDDDQGTRASRGPAIRDSRDWLVTHGFQVVCYWQHDNWYLGASTYPAGGYADPDGVAAYQELVAASVS